ncbi:MAG: ABC transporter ATP-binding protein [Flavobacteriales bacterium]
MKSLSYLNKYLRQYKWLLLGGIVFIAISDFFGVWAQDFVREAFDTVEDSFLKEKETKTGEFFSLLTWFVLMYLLYNVIKGFFLFLQRQTIIVMSRHIEFHLKNEVYEHYQKLTPAFYKRNNTGDLMNRISEDVGRVRMYVGPGIMYTINLVVLFVLVIYKMISVNPELTLYVLAPLPLMAILVYTISKKLNRESEQVQKQQSLLSTIAQETFSGIRIIKSYGIEERKKQDFNSASQEYKKRNIKLTTTNAWFMPAMTLLVGISTALTVLIGGYQWLEGRVSMGNIPEFVIYVNMLTWPFASVGWVTSLVQRAAASQERINEFLSTQPEIKTGTEKPASLQGKIEFKNVSFVYPDTGITALKNVSFSIEPGQTLGVIGRTGSGKSTLSALLTRQYDDYSGEILLDGRPITSYDTAWLRSHIGYVPQDVFLFSDTIKENILFGTQPGQVNNTDLEQAADNAAVLDNIRSFPAGFETVLGERGITLSGGQKQRVSIARAIIRKPSLLLFDDCLSAVDTETEDTILNNLLRIMKGHSTLLISHRVSTVKHADKIVVLDNGQIVEEGIHADLLLAKGNYHSLYVKQSIEKEEVSD